MSVNNKKATISSRWAHPNEGRTMSIWTRLSINQVAVSNFIHPRPALLPASPGIVTGAKSILIKVNCFSTKLIYLDRYRYIKMSYEKVISKQSNRVGKGTVDWANWLLTLHQENLTKHLQIWQGASRQRVCVSVASLSIHSLWVYHRFLQDSDISALHSMQQQVWHYFLYFLPRQCVTEKRKHHLPNN